MSEIVEALVARARHGDMHAWARLYQDLFDGLFRHVTCLTGDRTIAEDLVQETFARALVKLPSFHGQSPISTWLHGIALNVVRTHWRSQATMRKHADVLVASPTSTETVDRTHLCREKARALYAALALLPEPLREAFILRELEGLSPAETALRVGTTPENVSVRAHRARERIRRELTRVGWLSRAEGTS